MRDSQAFDTESTRSCGSPFAVATTGLGASLRVRGRVGRVVTDRIGRKSLVLTL